jgi:hypothetical protein
LDDDDHRCGADAGRSPAPRIKALFSSIRIEPALESKLVFDAIVTPWEVNRTHGTGVLLRTIFDRAPDILSIRSANGHGGPVDFGREALLIPQTAQTQTGAIHQAATALRDRRIKRILCVPFGEEELRTSMALLDICGARLAGWIMDDQCALGPRISGDLMREWAARTRLRLAISPEMRVLYEQHFKMPWYYMPPLAPARHMSAQEIVPEGEPDPRLGVVIGNIWNPRWLDHFRRIVRGAGVELDWYPGGGWRAKGIVADSLAGDSIRPHDPLAEEELVSMLRSKWFAVLPLGIFEKADEVLAISMLSLPSRLIFMMCTAHLPVIVLGDRRTPAARFVEQFGIGLQCEHDRDAFREAVAKILRRDVNLAMRRRALAASSRFSDTGAADWIWKSLERGKPADRRYEDLMPAKVPGLSHLAGFLRG